MAVTHKQTRKLAVGLGFLAPNILGFLAFTVIPLVFSLVMAFSNWDLRLHNMFRHEPLKFVGLENFVQLVTQPSFWRFLGNTLFLMMGLPFSIAGSLLLALLLNRNLRGKRPKVFAIVITGAILASALGLLLLMKSSFSNTIMMLGVLSCGLLLLGVVGGSTVYRTLLYLPHFTAGMATILLWKNLYNPQVGPINQALRPILNTVAAAVNASPAGLIRFFAWIWAGLLIVGLAWGLRRIRIMWSDGDVGWSGTASAAILILLPTIFAPRWMLAAPGSGLPWLAAAVLLYQIFKAFHHRDFYARAREGFGSAVMFGMALMVCEFALLGVAIVFLHLPAMAADGLDPPGWHTDYFWAKPAMMIIGFWAALGSNNMLLYVAGLANVSPELYEAADIDGASTFQRFWNVTWPQLAPTTFFIVVISVIGGLQGGFEVARALTRGGPDGATTTLSYFIYTEGFETGRLGYSSAVAWALFFLVFAVTVFNWNFGSRYVEE